MALKSELMAGSLPSQAARMIGFDPVATIAAAGSGQSTATQLTGNFANVSSGTGGVIIPNNNEQTLIVNTSGGSINVYPPVGGAFNFGTANAAISVNNNKSIWIEPIGSAFVAQVSA